MTKPLRHPRSRLEYAFAVDAAHPYDEAVRVMVVCGRCHREQPNAHSVRNGDSHVGCFACDWPVGTYA